MDIDREDIASLANALYKIPKSAEKIARQLDWPVNPELSVMLTGQASLIKSAVEIVARMVSDLRDKPSLQQMKSNSASLRELEEKTHQRHLDALRIIYSGTLDPVRTVVMKDVFDQLEKLFERCDEAGRIASLIVVKQA